MGIMRACPRKCVYLLLVVSCLIIFTIIYEQYQDKSVDRSLSVSGDRDEDSGWTEDDVWNFTPATQEETVEGPCSVRQLIRKDQLLGKHFSFSVPVLQWAGSLSKPTWERLRSHAPPYGWRGLPLTVVRSTLALLNSSHSGRLFERRSPDQCVRCAVVGNGGILRGSKQGQAIDSHDLVFRVNGAVTKGFEEDVGTKISFYGFTTNTMKHSLRFYRRDGFTKVPQGPEIRYIFIPSNIRDYVMMAAAIRGQTVTTGDDAGDWPPRYFGTRPPEHFKMLHPDFITYVTQGFLKSPLMSLRATGHLYMPSTGALMLMTALHTCDEVSAYGFITRNYADFSDHYYDSVRKPLKFYANHDMKMESWLWEALHHRGVMRLYQRAANS
ncbi:alpha-N-acetylgalactosaminide alpha-2,6-sialyltransferase 2 [Myripristis murdjan]|uniref:alpha-N-acetylgalactosaminide alpha-2,6-sialyltransferase n=1 Tax=Myripristis murdjan TaxID=586833 RepID=A0A667WPP8_9TELE|nr:alpha-N-acetylgalactosaminide alpha-2,6-sialyltransferase 2 [Myripristis murdjan]